MIDVRINNKRHVLTRMLLCYFLNTYTFCSIKEIAIILNKKERTVYSDIDKISRLKNDKHVYKSEKATINKQINDINDIITKKYEHRKQSRYSKICSN